jgi:pyruvate ferredoxin oxidoreductase gamma subunit
MFQVRIHGRGGQGVVTAAEMLSLAAFREGQHAQAFPSFGSERTGAPVMAFARIDSREIRLREPIVSPDAVIVQDRTLLHQVDVFQGLGQQGYVLINSSHTVDELGLAELARRLPAGHFQLLPATQFAMAQLGRPLPGAAMIAGFAALTALISLAAVQAAYRERFSGKVAEANAEVARLAYEHVRASLKESAHA